MVWLDFDIEQEKQRSYTFLDTDKIESYLNSVICGDIQEMPVRKLIVKTFVREVILDNDSVTITYNFTETLTKYKITQETLQQIKRQSVKKTANNKTLCSNKLPSLPPKVNCTHTKNELRTFFVTEEYFGICVYFGTKKNLYDIIKTWNG